MRRPVCRLLKVVYGHPGTGFWENKCDSRARRVGFEPMGPEWPLCYTHASHGLFLVIYADAFRFFGPERNLAQGWQLLRSGFSIEPEQRYS
eukprot:11164136-Lingulodinium_polyedra.AAC.1